MEQNCCNSAATVSTKCRQIYPLNYQFALGSCFFEQRPFVWKQKCRQNICEWRVVKFFESAHIYGRIDCRFCNNLNPRTKWGSMNFCWNFLEHWTTIIKLWASWSSAKRQCTICRNESNDAIYESEAVKFLVRSFKMKGIVKISRSLFNVTRRRARLLFPSGIRSDWNILLYMLPE
jgi:hypothetical protein